ncbi:MAG TPA: leucyl aminopeptidase family protein [Stellaceae bacterium]|nr:leucyl aminopeptidase family protein [Stellaceae bacterium]
MLDHLIADRSGAVPILPVTEDGLAGALAKLDETERRWVEATHYLGAPGTFALLPDSAGRLKRVLIGVRPGDELWSLAALPDALPPLSNQGGAYKLEGEHSSDAATRFALGWALGCYAFTRYRERDKPWADLVWPAKADRARVERLARGMGLARDLINTPAEDMGPPELAAAAQELASRHGARYRVIVGDDLLTQNYPAIHTVGRAAEKAPRLIDFVWGNENDPKLTLVGKGVCFDTGGLDLKPSGGMRMMKKDMGGAASLLGLASAIMDAKLPVRLRVMVPAVENAVAGNAFRPLDIIKTRKGMTVEVGNTDAEGRLILCDALYEACGEQPALLIDMATLTGAARTALGPELPALFSNDDTVANELLHFGLVESDPLWRLPLWKPYRQMIVSPIADLNNVSESGFAGAITAALYLEAFVTPATPWIHIDTYAWNQKNRPGRPEGGEALAMRALYALIEHRFGRVAN